MAQIQEAIYLEYGKAKEHYLIALKINPKYTDAYNNLGCLLEENFKDHEYAILIFLKAIESNPFSVQANYNYGRLLDIRFGNFEKAAGYYKRVIELDSKFVQAYINLGILLESQLDDINGAIVLYEKAIKIAPSSETAHFNLARVFVKVGDFDSAMDHYKIAINISPLFANAYLGIGVILEFHSKDFNGAKIQYEKAVEIDPKLEQAKQFLNEIKKNYFS